MAVGLVLVASELPPVSTPHRKQLELDSSPNKWFLAHFYRGLISDYLHRGRLEFGGYAAARYPGIFVSFCCAKSYPLADYLIKV